MVHKLATSTAAFGVTTMLLVTGLLPATANAHASHGQHHKTPHVYVLHGHKHHCRKGYVKRHKTVKHHQHKQHVVLCVKSKHEQAKHRSLSVAAPALPVATAPVVKLHAHLDPTFARDPSNPFRVTYNYSASATSETVGLALSQTETSLPEGVLTLYNDGLLACSINVGGSTTGGECPVTYSTLGAHTVTTIYQSGSTSATETASEMIEPFSTTTSGTVGYEALAAPVKIGEEDDAYCDGNCYEVGKLIVNAKTESPYGVMSDAPTITECDSSSGCVDAVEVCVEQGEESQAPYNVVVRRVFFGDEFPRTEGISPSETESGVLYMQVASPKLNGYIESSARLTVTFPAPGVVE